MEVSFTKYINMEGGKGREGKKLKIFSKKKKLVLDKISKLQELRQRKTMKRKSNYDFKLQCNEHLYSLNIPADHLTTNKGLHHCSLVILCTSFLIIFLQLKGPALPVEKKLKKNRFFQPITVECKVYKNYKCRSQFRIKGSVSFAIIFLP